MSPRSQVAMMMPKCGRYGCSVGKTRPPIAQVLVGFASLVRVRNSRRVAPCRFGCLRAPPSAIQWCHSSLSKKS